MDGQKKGMTPAETVLMAAGVYGCLFLLFAPEGISFNRGLVCVTAAAVCMALRYTSAKGERYVLAFVAGMTVCCLLAAVIFGKTIGEQILVLAQCFLGDGEGDGRSVTAVLLLAAALVPFGFFLLEFVLKAHWLLCVLTTGLLLLPPFFGINAGLAPVLFLTVFQVVFWGMRISEARRRKRSLSGQNGRRIKGACAAVTVGILAAVLLISAVIVYPNKQEIYHAVYAGEGLVYRTARKITGTADEPVADGHISRGNNYRTGTVQLVLTASRKPEETLYLKGFAGGEYKDSQWEYADDRQIFENIADEMGWGSWGNWLNGMFSGMYFMMNSASPSGEEQPPIRLNVRQMDEEIRQLYLPYYSGWGNLRERFQVQRPGYAVQYYEQKDMAVDGDGLSANLGEAADWFREIQDCYMKEIQTAYTQVPEEELPGLVQLCSENPAEDTDEATAFILSLFRENTSYTLTPGNAPVNTDIVEYFLFDSGKGYCVHYASAAVLMYRLYGIPARYAAGYAVQPSDFTQQDDGTWRAEVTDEKAHAWAEIFMEDYGWTPVEVTPSSDGTYAASYPGFDLDAEELPAVTGLRRNAGDESGDGDSETGENREDTGETLLQRLPGGRRLWAGACCAALAVLLVLTPLFFDYRRLRRLRRLEESGSRRIFSAFMEMLHFSGYMKKYDGTEAGFAGELARQVPDISADEAGRFMDAVNRAAYSREGCSRDDDLYVYSIYKRTASFLYSGLKKSRRLIFRYVKNFG